MIRRLTPRWRLRATAAALVLPPLLGLISLEKIAGWVARQRLPDPPDPGVDDEALAEWVDRVLHRLPPPWKHTCLRRAVALHYLVHRTGRPAELRIGVRRNEEGELAAHAWLMREGQLHLERGTEQVSSFQVLATFPAAKSGAAPT